MSECLDCGAKWCDNKPCSERAGHDGEHNVGGVDLVTWARVLTLPVPEFGDHWSCAMRPGSWEWQTEHAGVIRDLLARNLYEPYTPDGMFVRWRRPVETGSPKK